ncbi:MAG TPA: hypothetical protein VMA35_12605 [Candidatus Sulfopaludibacter sp.]|nr:hypothetical protein [Candidatus Sulfopaludibacter sp.]
MRRRFVWIEKVNSGRFVPCAADGLLLKPWSLAAGGRGGPKGAFFQPTAWKEGGFLSNLHRNGFERNMKNINALKRQEVFERKTSWRETQQPILITKGRNQRQIHE